MKHGPGQPDNSKGCWLYLFGLQMDQRLLQRVYNHKHVKYIAVYIFLKQTKGLYHIS